MYGTQPMFTAVFLLEGISVVNSSTLPWAAKTGNLLTLKTRGLVASFEYYDDADQKSEKLLGVRVKYRLCQRSQQEFTFCKSHFFENGFNTHS